MNPFKSGLKVIAIMAFLTVAAQYGHGQERVSHFYTGKTITMEVGAAPGGVLDMYARVLSRHLARHIPGTPTLKVQYRPGAGSKVAARALTTAPKDGTWLVGTFPSAIVDPLLEITSLGYDPTKFQYIGSLSNEVPICMVRSDASVQSVSDLMKVELITSVTSPGGTNYDFPAAVAGLTGAKFRFVKGYPGGSELNLAIVKNEVQGVCGSWSYTKIQYPDILKGKDIVRIVLQGSPGNQELAAAGVPDVLTLIKRDQDREAMELFLTRYVFAQPYMVPEGTPLDRVQTLRKAFMEAVADRAFVEEADRIKIVLHPTDGEAIQSLVQKIYSTPKPTVERLRKALNLK